MVRHGAKFWSPVDSTPNPPTGTFPSFPRPWEPGFEAPPTLSEDREKRCRDRGHFWAAPLDQEVQYYEQRGNIGGCPFLNPVAKSLQVRGCCRASKLF